jgi:hypothetical protein
MLGDAWCMLEHAWRCNLYTDIEGEGEKEPYLKTEREEEEKPDILFLLSSFLKFPISFCVPIVSRRSKSLLGLCKGRCLEGAERLSSPVLQPLSQPTG